MSGYTLEEHPIPEGKASLVNPVSVNSKKIALILSGAAIVMRLASDWIFPQGGPIYYQAAQAACLILALIFLRSQLDYVFLRGGNLNSSLREGLLGIPIGLAGGLAIAWIQFGGLQWPTLDKAAILVANNCFFPVVEELEFRGFFLGWLTDKKVTPIIAIWIAAVLHLLAHIHLFLQGNYLMAGITLLLFVWYGSMTVRTRSLWGAILAHVFVNIAGFLPSSGSGTDIMRK